MTRARAAMEMATAVGLTPVTETPVMAIPETVTPETVMPETETETAVEMATDSGNPAPELIAQLAANVIGKTFD